MNISIIVPTYNRAHMIDATLRSILAQTYRNIEVVVVDDGSTDNTEEVVAGIARQSIIPMQYLKKANGGCSTARNAGVRAATGDCIAFLDSDDQFTSNAIESLLKTMNTTGADFVYSPSIIVNAQGEEKLRYPAASGRPDQFSREHFLTLGAQPCSILYRRLVFNKVMFDEVERYNEDADFLQKVAISFKAAYSDVPTAKVFQHDGNKSSNTKEIFHAMLRSYESILSNYPEFAQSVRDVAPQRLREVRIALAEAMIMDGEFTEAKIVLHSLRRKPSKLILSILLKSAVPIDMLKWLKRKVKIIKGFLSEQLAVC